MNKTVLVVTGALAVLGVGAYFYLKSKKTTQNTTGGLVNQTTTGDGASDSLISVPSSGTTLTTPQQVADTAKKIADAKELAVQISDLKRQKDALSLKVVNQSSATSMINPPTDVTAIHWNMYVLDNKIRDLTRLINDLGYTELNGSIVKIV
jgi:hypothetical protein